MNKTLLRRVRSCVGSKGASAGCACRAGTSQLKSLTEFIRELAWQAEEEQLLLLLSVVVVVVLVVVVVVVVVVVFLVCLL